MPVVGQVTSDYQLMQPRWYAVFTRCRHEKVAADHLCARGFENFLPLYEAVHQWHDRRKLLHLPLFPGYVFVRIAPEQRAMVLTTFGVQDFVGARPSGTPIPDEEIQSISRLLNRNFRLEACPFLTVGDRVQVRYGPLAGTSGILVRVKDNYRIVVSINLIQRSVMAEIDAADVLPHA